jgi:hypothetical protein
MCVHERREKAWQQAHTTHIHTRIRARTHTTRQIRCAARAFSKEKERGREGERGRGGESSFIYNQERGREGERERLRARAREIGVIHWDVGSQLCGHGPY